MSSYLGVSNSGPSSTYHLPSVAISTSHHIQGATKFAEFSSILNFTMSLRIRCQTSRSPSCESPGRWREKLGTEMKPCWQLRQYKVDRELAPRHKEQMAKLRRSTLKILATNQVCSSGQLLSTNALGSYSQRDPNFSAYQGGKQAVMVSRFCYKGGKESPRTASTDFDPNQLFPILHN